MVHKHTDVLDVVNATRPAQTAGRILETHNRRRRQAGLSEVSMATVRASLHFLRQLGVVVRLMGDDAAACGAFPHQYSTNTAFWISAENYRTYHPGAEPPPIGPVRPESRSASGTGDQPETEAVSGTEAAAQATVEATTTAMLAELDELRAHAHTALMRLAEQDPSAGSPERQLASRLVTLLHDLGDARWAFIGGPQAEEAEPENRAATMPLFLQAP